jgi:hypothetical protein
VKGVVRISSFNFSRDIGASFVLCFASHLLHLMLFLEIFTPQSQQRYLEIGKGLFDVNLE